MSSRRDRMPTTSATRGRPPSLPATNEVIERIKPALAEVLDRLVEMAKQGDMQAARLLLERAAPAPRPDSERVVVPGFAEAPTLAAKAEAVIKAAATGAISAQAARDLLSVLDLTARAAKVDEFEARLLSLEQRRAPAKPIGPAAPLAIGKPAPPADDIDFSDLA